MVYSSSFRERGCPSALFCGILVLISGKRLPACPLLWYTRAHFGKEAALVPSFVVYSSGKRLVLCPLLWYTRPHFGKEAARLPSFVVYSSSVRERGCSCALFCGILLLSSGKRLLLCPLLWYTAPQFGKEAARCALFCGILLLSSGKRLPLCPLLWYTAPQFGKEAALAPSFVVYPSSFRERGCSCALFCGILLLSSGKRLLVVPSFVVYSSSFRERGCSLCPLLWYTPPQFGKEAALVPSFVVYSSSVRERGCSFVPSFVVYSSSVRERGCRCALFCGILVLSSEKWLLLCPLLWYTRPQFGKEAAVVPSFVVYSSSVRERGCPTALFWLGRQFAWKVNDNGNCSLPCRRTPLNPRR